MGGEQNLSDDSVTEPRHADYGSIDISDDDTVISKGSLDPVYEAKAKILNRAVSGSPSASPPARPSAHRQSPRSRTRAGMEMLMFAPLYNRSKILAWVGTNGSSS